MIRQHVVQFWVILIEFLLWSVDITWSKLISTQYSVKKYMKSVSGKEFSESLIFYLFLIQCLVLGLYDYIIKLCVHMMCIHSFFTCWLIYLHSTSFNNHTLKAFWQLIIFAFPMVLGGTSLTALVAGYILPYGWTTSLCMSFGGKYRILIWYAHLLSLILNILWV